MSMPGSAGRDPDEDFRLLYDEENEDYYIQKKRLIFGWKFVNFTTKDLSSAKTMLNNLRVENRKYRIKKRFVVVDV